VTRLARQEYAAALRARYRAAGKHERGRILDEFCRTTGCHRKAAIRLLRHAPVRRGGRRGRPRRYGPELVPVLKEQASALPAFCFARTGSYEIEVGGKKLVGSAQRRQARAFLQHGSVLLGADVERIRLLFPGEGDPLAGMTTLEAELGRRPTFDETVAALVAGFREACGLTLAPGGLHPQERQLMEQLMREKYATEAWTRDGRVRADLAAAHS